MAEAQRSTIPISGARKGPQKVNFTKRTVEALKAPEKGRRYVYDSKTDGLAVAVSYSGSKTFYVYRKVHGRPQRIRLGRFPEMTVEQARRQAVKVAAEIAEGKDPQARKQRQRAEMTLGELHRRYMAEHAKVHKRSWKDDEDLFRRYLIDWKSRRLSTISRADVQKKHRTIGESAPVGANRMLALLSKMFGFALDLGVWEGENPCKGIKRFREKSRDRFLQADELPRFLEAVQAEPNETMRDYFLLSLLVGGRRGNMLAMRWDELHLSRGEWRIPETKNGEALTVHLPPAAVEILQERQKRSCSVWVFPSKTSKSGHIEEPKTAWRRVCQRTGLKDVRLHDLRRTLGSWQAATGASLPVIGKSLGHKNQQTTAIYARLNLDPVKESVNAATEAMLQAATDQRASV